MYERCTVEAQYYILSMRVIELIVHGTAEFLFKLKLFLNNKHKVKQKGRNIYGM